MNPCPVVNSSVSTVGCKPFHRRSSLLLFFASCGSFSRENDAPSPALRRRPRQTPAHRLPRSTTGPASALDHFAALRFIVLQHLWGQSHPFTLLCHPRHLLPSFSPPLCAHLVDRWILHSHLQRGSLGRRRCRPLRHSVDLKLPRALSHIPRMG